MADVRVATILTWADRIIALVNAGQLVEAIELTTLYYHGQSNSASASMGLAEDEDLRRSVVAPKLREIMHASIEYAFSEERLRDHTHVTPDGQGVDRTALFESLVDACLRACMACDDLDFVFSVLLERYQANGITNIFLHRVEPFILSRTLSQVPTLVSSLLIDLCEFEGQVEIAERIVFSVDPTSLDLDRVIKLSQRQHLPDCLVYIETTILQDWRTPLGRLLEQVHSIEISRLSDNDRTHVERQVPEAYKVFALLGSGLTGLAFYTGTRLTVSSGNCAREQLYSMLFSEKVPANLALRDFTNTNSSYPCLRLLLLFDSEAFLDTLDQALEDSFLDEHPVTSRQEIVDILLEISTTPRPLTSADLAFIYIFVARNLPKYPQFLSLPQQRLHDILLALVDDPDQSTLEDRQLAMEYLLSVYRPDDFDSVASRLENAGFYRVLRTQYRSLHQWAAYVHATLDDSDLYDQVFDQLAQALRFAAKDDSPDKQGSLEEALLGGVPQMVGVDLFATVDLISRFMPKLHWRALDSLEGQPNRQYAYLRRLLDSEFTISTSFLEEREKPLKERYVELLCQFDPQQVVPYLSKSSETVSSTLIAICADRGVDAAVIWAFGRNNEPLRAVEKWGDVAAHIVSEVLRAVQQHDSSPDNNNEPREAQGDSMAKLVAAATVAIQVCVDAKVSANASEDIWFKLLSTMVETNASFSAMTSRVVRNIGASQISNILPDALSALMSTSSSGAISFPKLTRRLIEGQTKASFRDVRPIFQSISEAYHFEEESLMMAKHLVDEDLFTQGAQLRRQMSRGWAAGAATCQICHQPAWGSALETSQDRTRHDAVNELMTQLCAPPKAAAVQRKASLKGKEARWPDEHDQAQLTDFESSPADAFRALVVSRTGSVFHRSCYESGNQDADSTLG